ncbi:DUF6233 domain-containing protein [Streptomyces sp. NBC_01022]|uniref:DUF6233 domain-containing protein n=1 Tax=Streptomyces sp. NBC_01022 TaxID=2903723 RepID=UPI002DD86A2C|nr:DUF6233 domain-containing protein [Streptomyces sp. NBC_01022]
MEQQLTIWIGHARAAIAAAEQREAERRKGEERHPPDWIVELGIGVGAPPTEVHAGDCYAAGKRRRVIDRDQARALLSEGIRACTHCRPDTDLGVLG